MSTPSYCLYESTDCSGFQLDCFDKTNITNKCYKGALSVKSFETTESVSHVLLNCPKEGEDWGIDATFNATNGCRMLHFEGKNFTGVSIDEAFFAKEHAAAVPGKSPIANALLSLAMIALMIGPFLLVLVGRSIWMKMKGGKSDDKA